MIRGLLVAAALALLWPAATRWLIAWFVFVGPFLVLSSSHTPSDVLGGLLVAGALLAAARGLAASAAVGRLDIPALLRLPGGAAAAPPGQRASR
jgi:hypothetical protein